jgi:hypothetical protein
MVVVAFVLLVLIGAVDAASGSKRARPGDPSDIGSADLNCAPLPQRDIDLGHGVEAANLPVRTRRKSADGSLSNPGPAPSPPPLVYLFSHMAYFRICSTAWLLLPITALQAAPQTMTVIRALLALLPYAQICRCRRLSVCLSLSHTRRLYLIHILSMISMLYLILLLSCFHSTSLRIHHSLQYHVLIIVNRISHSSPVAARYRQAANHRIHMWLSRNRTAQIHLL